MDHSRAVCSCPVGTPSCRVAAGTSVYLATWDPPFRVRHHPAAQRQAPAPSRQGVRRGVRAVRSRANPATLAELSVRACGGSRLCCGRRAVCSCSEVVDGPMRRGDPALGKPSRLTGAAGPPVDGVRWLSACVTKFCVRTVAPGPPVDGGRRLFSCLSVCVDVCDVVVVDVCDVVAVTVEVDAKPSARLAAHTCGSGAEGRP